MSCKITVKGGDCLEVLTELKDNSVHAIVTDPPYGIAFMGEVWDKSTPPEEVWAECLRVLKPGGHIIAFAAARTYHRLATYMENVGFEIRSSIAWLYSEGMPHGLNVRGYVESLPYPHNLHANKFEGWHTELKPAYEPAVLARKPYGKLSLGEVVIQHGTGGLNIAATKPQTQESRFTPNVLTDCSEAIARELGERARFYYCAQATREERDRGLDNFKPQEYRGTYGDGIGNSPSVNGKRQKKVKNTHPTVKPVALMQWCCNLITPAGGLVLDPFLGSGTTGCAAALSGFSFIGIEKNSEYARIATGRIQHYATAGQELKSAHKGEPPPRQQQSLF